GYNLRDARERVELRGNVVRQVDEQIDLTGPGSADSDCYGYVTAVSLLVDYFMRNEASVAKSPEQLIELPCILPVRRLDVHGVFQAIRLLRQAAGENLP